MTAPPPVAALALASRVEAETEAKRSRFLAVVAPVADESAARAVVDERRAAHSKARHHCSAVVLGPDGEVRRADDDGEPSGTAGQPMLDALCGAELGDVVAVVTRYFGGTLLGAGGLVRAYRGAVQAALAGATTLRRQRLAGLAMTLDYADAAAVEREAARAGWPVLDADYGAEVRLRIGVPGEDASAAAERITAATAGRASPVPAPGAVRTLPE